MNIIVTGLSNKEGLYFTGNPCKDFVGRTGLLPDFASGFYIAPRAIQGFFAGFFIAAEPYIIFFACFQLCESIGGFGQGFGFHILFEFFVRGNLYLISGGHFILDRKSVV